MAIFDPVRFDRARSSLEGLSVGDAFGEYFFGIKNATSRRIMERILPPAPWHFSDDTMMALSIVSILRQYGEMNQDQLALNFAQHYEQSRGYGPATRRLMAHIKQGEYWHDAAQKLFKGQGSYGNGSAMRVAPLGAYFADNFDLLVEQAIKSSEITHRHPEGVAGAIAIAIAAGIANQSRTTSEKLLPNNFLTQVTKYVPESEVKAKIEQACTFNSSASITQVAAAIGNGSNITAQDTVPFTLWCAAQYLDNYEAALWLTASGGGDVDTTCAIVGGIVAAYVGIKGIPAEWLKRREPLPEWAFTE